MGNVIEFRKNKRFTLQEARGLLPIVRRITKEAVSQVRQIREQLEILSPVRQEQSHFEVELQEVIERWSQKIAKLGAEPKGFWLVDFDTGEGYLCWKHPEEEIEYFHPYEAGYSGRTQIH